MLAQRVNPTTGGLTIVIDQPELAREKTAEHVLAWEAAWSILASGQLYATGVISLYMFPYLGGYMSAKGGLHSTYHM